jgi:hypothetical protein
VTATFWRVRRAGQAARTEFAAVEAFPCAADGLVGHPARATPRWRGRKNGDGESTGHASGRRIIALLRAKKADLTDNDYRYMRKVNRLRASASGATTARGLA